MERLNSIGEILEFAISREVEANQFYLYLSKRMRNPEIRQVCEDFAKEEIEHKDKLELELLKIGEIATDFNISKYIMQGPMQMDYDDLLLLAIKKENKSISLYSDLARIVKNEESRKVLLSLVQEETEHKQRFEIEHRKVL